MSENHIWNHIWNYRYGDDCVRCGLPRKLVIVRGAPCEVAADRLTLELIDGESRLMWKGNPGYFYYCAKCDYTAQLGVAGACGEAVVHSCRDGKGVADLHSPVDTVVDFLKALGKRPIDHYAEHTRKLGLRGIEALSLEQREQEEDHLGDAWATAGWEEP